MEKSASVLLLALALACVMGGAAALTQTRATAYWANYNPEGNNWAVNESLACYPFVANKPLEWRSKHGWTAFGPVDPQSQTPCGQCLSVINIGVYPPPQVTVRIVDAAGQGNLVLDDPVFDKLDVDGMGRFRGHLTVEYEFVDCGDCVDTKIRHYPH